ncbi:AAA family ATPase [Streptomyces sp. JV176]|uniref:helix-turn-helix transcriptional regulator n=1 Tax=Streptomyces sp. JV176 TaxID=858630 RepID=UPI002E76DEA9|nr:AAA family ATPase [Streptomyces sp. JV176]MEE1803277.1 AAA family ATPase [Streptomyces sp. JV176]
MVTGHITGDLRTGGERPLPRTEPELFGRDRVIQRMLDAATAPSGPAIHLVRGGIGAGRTALLGVVAERLRAAGLPVHAVACRPGDHLLAHLLAHRLITALSGPGGAAGAGAGAGGPAAVGGATGAGGTGGAVPEDRPLDDALRSHTEPRGSGEAVSVLLARTLRTRTPAVVLVDDVQFADPETTELLYALAPRLVSSPVRLILGVSPLGPVRSSSQRAGEEALLALADGVSIGAVDLPPLTVEEVARLLTHRLRAVPEQTLVEEAHWLTGGNPGALVAALHAGSRAIRTLIGHAHLVAGAPVPVLPDDDRFVRALRGLGDTAWRVAKALSVLEPLGERTAGLVAAATGLPEHTVLRALHRLTEPGLVAGPGRGAGWTFRIPLVAVAAADRLGPYERRAVSATAVHALWETADRGPSATSAPVAPADGMASTHRGAVVVPRDAASVRRTYLANRVVEAGTFVDRGRATAELLAAARESDAAEVPEASRWLESAAGLTDDPALLASTLARYAATADSTGNGPGAADAAAALLERHARAMDPGTRLELAVVELAARAASGDPSALCGPAALHRTRATGAGADSESEVLGVVALCLLGLWSEALNLIARSRAHSHPHPVARLFVMMCETAARLMTGDAAPFRRTLRHPVDGIPAPHLMLELTVLQCDFLLGMGELAEARALVARRGLTIGHLPIRNVMLTHYLAGSWDEAMASARSLMANSPATARMPASVLAHARTSTMLLARGWPSRARTVLDTARAVTNSMTYLLDAEQAAVHRLMGEDSRAEKALRRGLAEASEHGYAFGTEPLWAALAAMEAERGRPDRAATCLSRLERTAAASGGDSARLLALLTRVRVLRLCPDLRALLPDPDRSVREALSLARASGRPFETACTLLAVASPGIATGPRSEARLREAYDLFGELDALLWRYRTRTALRDAGLPVPDRRTVTEENERLLATLVAEGLSNRQLAAALGVSEGSVASRLTRLFHRTGLRSRVELATSMLTASYP